MNVLVTGAGGPAGVCVIKSLKGPHRVVSTDVDPLAAGLYLSEAAYLVPRANDPRFTSRLLEIVAKEQVAAVLPTVQEELIPIAERRESFVKAGAAVVVSNPEALRTATNKTRTYESFRGKEYCPRVYTEADVRFPAVVKPADARGGRGFYVCEDRDELRLALARNRRVFPESIIMEYVAGTEYSTYGLSDLDGKPLVAIPIRRIQAVSESKKAETVSDPRISGIAEEVASELGLVGPWNIQLMSSAATGEVKLIEVNPRFAGTTSLVVASGVNLPELAIRVVLGEKIAPEELRYRSGLSMTRYNEEIFLTQEELIRPGP